MILWARPWLVIGRRAAGGGPEGEVLPAARYPPPPGLGLRVKFQPPHVTRHGRCFRPAPLSRGPPNRSSPWTPATPDAERLQGSGSGQTPCSRATRTDCFPPLRGNLSPGDFGEPPAPAGIAAPWPAPERTRGRGPGAGRVPTGTWGFLGFPAPRHRAQGGGVPSVRLSAPVSSREAVRRLGPSAARVSGDRAVAEPPLGTPALSHFSLHKQAKQKDFQTCLGRDRMPNGLAPSFFPSCYLSRPVVWGESARGPTPTRGSRLGGGAHSAGVPRGARGAVRIGGGSQCRQGGMSLGRVAPWGYGSFWGCRGEGIDWSSLLC